MGAPHCSLRGALGSEQWVPVEALRGMCAAGGSLHSLPGIKGWRKRCGQEDLEGHARGVPPAPHPLGDLGEVTTSPSARTLAFPLRNEETHSQMEC